MVSFWWLHVCLETETIKSNNLPLITHKLQKNKKLRNNFSKFIRISKWKHGASQHCIRCINTIKEDVFWLLVMPTSVETNLSTYCWDLETDLMCWICKGMMGWGLVIFQHQCWWKWRIIRVFSFCHEAEFAKISHAISTFHASFPINMLGNWL